MLPTGLRHNTRRVCPNDQITRFLLYASNLQSTTAVSDRDRWPLYHALSGTSLAVLQVSLPMSGLSSNAAGPLCVLPYRRQHQAQMAACWGRLATGVRLQEDDAECLMERWARVSGVAPAGYPCCKIRRELHEVNLAGVCARFVASSR